MTTVTATNPNAAAQTSSSNSAAQTSSATASTLSANNGLASLADNFQSFLTLLTTQLRNQDPLNPTDTNQFTQQITQMTGVEQQLLTNNLLQSLVAVQSGVASGANLIGDTVSAPGATSSDPAISGTVTSVEQVNGQTMVTVNGQQVPMSSLTSVTAVSNPLSSLLGG